ncbi:MAG: hypothetical protein HUJ25_09985 [Crocinitomicaceae bacterium]|nr:hypothetical protein [Crocinitomicaceae bacterium]
MMRSIQIGDSTVQILQEYGNLEDQILFINVHEDEQTSIDAVYEFAKENPVRFVRLKHNETRRIDFSLRGRQYSVDPNRIFTGVGRWKTLRDGGKYSFKASRSVKYLANEILNYVHKNAVIIAMHNNTDVNYSIKSYLPGGDESKNTKEIYINEAMDPDDFIYTTDESFFYKLKEKKINVILQDNKRYVNDGSLSVYCGKNGIPYINIEAQKGHFDEQVRLIQEVLSIL